VKKLGRPAASPRITHQTRSHSLIFSYQDRLTTGLRIQAKASRAELVSFARAGRHGWPERFADRVSTALSVPSLPTGDYLAYAKAAGIRLAAV
jgi:hypothetical protein